MYPARRPPWSMVVVMPTSSTPGHPSSITRAQASFVAPAGWATGAAANNVELAASACQAGPGVQGNRAGHVRGPVPPWRLRAWPALSSATAPVPRQEPPGPAGDLSGDSDGVGLRDDPAGRR